MLRFLAEIRQVRRNNSTNSPSPTSMLINITGQCPCRCWHCEKADETAGDHLPRAAISRYQHLAGKWNCPVLYSGGEPMVHPDWQQILQSGLDLGLSQKIITSGVGFHRLSAPDTDLMRRSLSDLFISLDSADGPTHDRLRGVRGLYDRIMGYLDQSHRPAKVWLIHVPPPDWNGVEAVLELARAKSAGVLVQPLIFVSNFPDLPVIQSCDDLRTRLPLLADQVAHRVAELTGLARTLGVPSNLDEVQQYIRDYYRLADGPTCFSGEALPRFECTVPWQQITVDEFGQVQPCVLLKGQPVPTDGDPEETWRAQALDFRAQIQGGQTWPECRACCCHFGSNYRNSALTHPWSNRRGYMVLGRKWILNAWARIQRGGLARHVN